MSSRLIYPNFQDPFVLTTDASAFVIGAALSQESVSKNLPITYATRNLYKAKTIFIHICLK